MAELLSRMYIRDMHLDDRRLQRADAVVQGDARMRVGPGIQHDAVVDGRTQEPRFLQLVDQLALHVALIVVYLHVAIAFAQTFQIVFEGGLSVDSRFALSQEVQVRPVDDEYFHSMESSFFSLG